MTLKVLIQSLGLVPGTLLTILAGFVFLALPLWCIVDCAHDRARTSRSRLSWLVAMILFWGIAPFCYALFSTRSRSLKVGMGGGITALLVITFCMFHLFGEVIRSNDMRVAFQQAQEKMEKAAGRDQVDKIAASGGKFIAVWAADGKSPRRMTAFLKNGSTVGERVGLASNITHVAEDRAERLYGIFSKGLGAIDPATGKLKEAPLPKELSRVTGLSGVALDPKEDRLLVVSEGGAGFLVEYSLRTKIWKPIAPMSNRNYAGLTFDPKTGTLYTVLEPRPGHAIENLTKLNLQGDPSGELRLSPPIRLPRAKGEASSVQLSYSEGTLAIIVGAKQDGIYLVDKNTGAVTRPTREASPARAVASGKGKSQAAKKPASRRQPIVNPRL